MRRFILMAVSAAFLAGAVEAQAAPCPPAINTLYKDAMRSRDCSRIRTNMNVLHNFAQGAPGVCTNNAQRNYNQVKAHYNRVCRRPPPPRCSTTRYVNVGGTTKGIPYVYWRRCLIGGQAKYQIRVFGECHPHDCDWGWRPAVRAGAPFKAFYNQGFVRRWLTIRFGGKFMRLRILNKYNDSRGTTVWSHTLRRP